MSEIRLEAIKDRLYMQRELRRLRKYRHLGLRNKQGRIDFLHRELQVSYMLFKS